MSNKLPRRTFLMSWLGGLLVGWLGRSQAHGSPKTTPGPAVPTAPAGKPVTLTVSDGTSSRLPSWDGSPETSSDGDGSGEPSYFPS